MRRVLVINDNKIETSLLRSEVTRLDYEIACACSGTEALAAAREFIPEVILLNPILPDMNGYDLCCQLRAQKEMSNVPILLIATERLPRNWEASIGLKDLARENDIKELQTKLETCLRVKTYLDQRIYNPNETETHLRKGHILSITDPVTGLLNKKYLQDILSQEFLRSQRYGTFFSLIMMDVDCFKEVNDSLGHDIGDQILYELSVVIRSQIRGVDILSRYGGDVLAALLPQSSSDMAVIVAKRISEAVRIHIFSRLGRGEDWKGKPLTVSMGICGLPNPHISQAIQVLSGADLALIRAKRMGRNKMEVATDQEVRLISQAT